eukprot:1160035-Pelagomonas_calceolata.AAC.1
MAFVLPGPPLKAFHHLRRWHKPERGCGCCCSSCCSCSCPAPPQPCSSAKDVRVVVRSPLPALNATTCIGRRGRSVRHETTWPLTKQQASSAKAKEHALPELANPTSPVHAVCLGLRPRACALP